MDILVTRTSQLITDVDLIPVIAAFNRHMIGDFAPAWGVSSTMYLNEAPEGAAKFSLQDTISIAGALGFHVDENGIIQGIIDVQLCKESGDDWRTCLFHEGDEATADPFCNRMAPNGIDIVEACDAVEQTVYNIDGIPASNFVLPAGFGMNSGTKYDFNGQLPKPIPEILPGGYLLRLLNGQWSDVMGEKAEGHYMNLRSGGRRDFRKSQTSTTPA